MTMARLDRQPTAHVFRSATVTQPRRKPAFTVLGTCAAGTIAGIVAMRFATQVYENHERLETRGVQVTARVTDARQMETMHELQFEVRYAFEVPDRPGTFTLRDETGRENLWATTDGQAAWEDAQRAGQVQVLYLPDDPRINRLVTRRGHPLGDPAAVFVLGLLLLGASLAVGGLEASGRGWLWRRLFDRMRGAKRAGG